MILANYSWEKIKQALTKVFDSVLFFSETDICGLVWFCKRPIQLSRHYFRVSCVRRLGVYKYRKEKLCFINIKTIPN
jgi:hypothetical protein